jgi:hypothetical protein
MECYLGPDPGRVPESSRPDLCNLQLVVACDCFARRRADDYLIGPLVSGGSYQGLGNPLAALAVDLLNERSILSDDRQCQVDTPLLRHQPQVLISRQYQAVAICLSRLDGLIDTPTGPQPAVDYQLVPGVLRASGQSKGGEEWGQA